MTTNPEPGPRRRRTVPLLAAAGVIAVVSAGILVARNHRDSPEPFAVALPSASPGVVGAAGYVNTHWRLTAVADGRGTTAIPASIDAWLELAADGELLASDDVNTVNGRFTVTGAGFDVSDTATTLAAYGGNDPVQVAAITAIDALAFGPPAEPSPAHNAPAAQPVHVTVLSATPGKLSIQASGVRLTFVRSGPASKVNASPLPHLSSATDR